MKRIQLFGLFALLGVLTVSCSHKQKTAGTSPYDANPYYAGTDGGSSSTASSPGAAQYPTYTDSAPTPEPPSAPSPPPSYPSYTGGSEPYPADNTYPDYPGANEAYNPYPSNDGGYTGGGSTHTVAAGENLYRISLRYGTTVRAIQEANGLSSDRINAGQVLRIP